MSKARARPDITVEAVEAAIQKTGSARGAAQLLNCNEKTIASRRIPGTIDIGGAGKPKSAKTLDSFRAAYDPGVKIPAAIRKGLAALLAAEGPEAWELEIDFCKRADVAQTVIGKYRSEFAEHIVEVRPDNRSGNKKLAWFGDARVAAKARGGPHG